MAAWTAAVVEDVTLAMGHLTANQIDFVLVTI
jgi:hypothetical protein